MFISNAKSQVTEDFKYTSYLFLNFNALEYKLGNHIDGFTYGFDPVVNVNKKLRINLWFDGPWLTSYRKMPDLNENQNELKKYRKIGFGINLALFEKKEFKSINFIIRSYSEGDKIVTEYTKEISPLNIQFAIRSGIENYRYIAEPNKRNADLINDGISDVVYLKTPANQIIWYQGYTNWTMNCLYLGFCMNRVYSSKVENSFGSGIMARYLTWYGDFLMPVSLKTDDIKLNNNTIDVQDAFKKNNFGFRLGVQTAGWTYVKIETGVLPGIKSGFFFNSSLGFTFKVLKRK